MCYRTDPLVLRFIRDCLGARSSARLAQWSTGSVLGVTIWQSGLHKNLGGSRIRAGLCWDERFESGSCSAHTTSCSHVSWGLKVSGYFLAAMASCCLVSIRLVTGRTSSEFEKDMSRFVLPFQRHAPDPPLGARCGGRHVELPESGPDQSTVWCCRWYVRLAFGPHWPPNFVGRQI